MKAEPPSVGLGGRPSLQVPPGATRPPPAGHGPAAPQCGEACVAHEPVPPGASSGRWAVGCLDPHFSKELLYLQLNPCDGFLLRPLASRCGQRAGGSCTR